jgi:O-antigen/teichoic acid export membrane protein
MTRARGAERFTRKLGTVAAGTAVAMVLSFALSIVVARLLGPSTLASYATVTASAFLLAQLNDLGLANAFAFFGRHRPGSIRTLLAILGRHLVFCFIVAIAAVAVLRVFGGPALQAAVSPNWFSAVIVVLLTLGTPVNVLPVLVLARGEYAAYARFSIFTVLFQLAGVLAGLIIAGRSWRAFVTGLAVAHAIIVVWEFWYLSRPSDGPPETVTSRDCYYYGLRIKWAEVMKLLSGRVDLLLVASVLSGREVGLYTVALSFRELGMSPLRVYSGIFQNLLVDRRRDHHDDRELVIGSLIAQTVFSIVFAAAAAIVFPLIVPLIYGVEYSEVAGPAAILFSSTIFLAVSGLCWTVFNMDGRPGLTSSIVTVLGLVGPSLVWMLSQRFGLHGAATAGVISGAIVCMVSLAMLVRLRRYTVEDTLGVAARVPAILRELRLGVLANARRIGTGSISHP